MSSRQTPEVRVLSFARITRPRRSYDPVRLPPDPLPSAVLKPRPSIERVSPDYPHHHSNVPRPLPRRTQQVHVSIASLWARPSPFWRWVGVRIDSFEACS